MDKYLRINENLKKELKIKAAQNGTSIKALAEIYIQQGLKNEEENEMKSIITVIRKINSYTGTNGWGYDCVEGSDGNIYHIKQEPDSSWKVGDDITNAKKEQE